MSIDYEISILCPKCKRPMVSADNVSPTDQIESGEYERPCKECEAEKRTLQELARDIKAQEYLTRKMIERFHASPVERFRRWSHNALHRAQYAMGHKYCWACNSLTHNRLEPKDLDHFRPASFYLNGR